MSSLFCSQGHANTTGARFCQYCGETLTSAPGSAASSAEAAAPSSPELPAGTRLRDRYSILHKLGQGGFGRTYLAEDTGRFNAKVVIKEFCPAFQGTQAMQKAEELFQREAMTLHRLHHPQIPQFWETFRDGDRLCLVQDFVEGPTYQQLLEHRLQSGQRFTEPEVVQFLQNILPVLSFMHHQGVIHRDISPDNIIQRQSDQLPVLIDLGGVKEIALNVAHQVGGGQRQAAAKATCLGKTGYAPIEQMQMGIVGPQSDLYALAATALTLLTGKHPQELQAPNSLDWQWQREMTLNPQLTELFQRMLARQPGQRPQSADEVLAVLQVASAVPPTILNSPGTTPPLQPPVAANPVVANSGWPPAMGEINTSGQGSSALVPPEIKGWNWGAFLLAPFWPFSNQVWIGLLSWIPLVGTVMAFILGAKGNEWAWQSRRWRSVQAFKSHQRAWTTWGVILMGLVVAIQAASALSYLVLQDSVSTTRALPEPSPDQSSTPATPDVETEPAPTTTTRLEIADAFLARTGSDDRLIRADNNRFNRGDTVNLVLIDVQPLQPDQNGQHWFDLKLQIQDPDGRTIFSKSDLLGEEGKIELTNDTASSPYAYFNTTEDLAPGAYTITLTIYDKIGTGQAARSQQFILE